MRGAPGGTGHGDCREAWLLCASLAECGGHAPGGQRPVGRARALIAPARPQDKRFTSGKYQDVYVELNHIKTRSEREIEQLREHLRLAMAALQEKEAVRNSVAE